MRILELHVSNFIGVEIAMGLRDFKVSFVDVDKQFIRIAGSNGIGKTVLLSLLHPFSSINLNGDERSDSPLIIEGEIGLKNIVIEHNGRVYNITHTYKPTSTSHTVYSSITEDGVELNSNGGVKTFNMVMYRIFGINQYIFQFIINSSNLTTFAKLSNQQRKTILNKCMGIDICDKIHKLSTQDYRYTNKLIQSLNSTKEFLVATYGTYENMVTMLDQYRIEYNTLSNQYNTIKDQLNHLSGKIDQLRNQNVKQDLYNITTQIESYNEIIQSIGGYNESDYDSLIDRQISSNSNMSDLKSQRMILMTQRDNLYDQKSKIQSSISSHNKTINDFNDMKKIRDEIQEELNGITITMATSVSSEKYKSLYSLGQTINSTCKEIVTCLNEKHLKLLVEMIENNIDIPSFLMRVNSSLMDSQKEEKILSRIRCMVNNVNGKYYECGNKDCVYKQTNDMLDAYFNSFQSVTTDKMTAYDLDQMDHAYKNIQVIMRLTSIEIPDELIETFSIKTIMNNIKNNYNGIDVDLIKDLMGEAVSYEMKIKYQQQLSDVERNIANMEAMINSVNDIGSVDEVDQSIFNLNQQIETLTNQIQEYQTELSNIDDKRLKLSRIKSVDIKDLIKQQTKLTKLVNELTESEMQCNELTSQFNVINTRMITVKNQLDKIESDHISFTKTEADITEKLTDDHMYKIIAEASSSTKGKPVEDIRGKVEDALRLTNRLLDIMYDGEVEMLKPNIDESHFALPFRRGTGIRPDIRVGSQSESALISMAFSLSVGVSITPYNIPLIDEMDAFTDSEFADSFVLMLSEIMAALKMEQMFIISHKICSEANSHLIFTLDLRKEIEKQK